MFAACYANDTVIYATHLQTLGSFKDDIASLRTATQSPVKRPVEGLCKFELTRTCVRVTEGSRLTPYCQL